MSQSVVIVGDTHVPTRASSIPEWVTDAVAEADHVVHTGDLTGPAVLERLRELAPDLTAVTGNMDPNEIDLPAVDTLDVAAVRFAVTHGTGPPEGYEERIREVAIEFERDDGVTVGVGGHTHECLDEVVDGVRLLNPGSATGAAPASETSIMVCEVDGADLSVEIRRA